MGAKKKKKEKEKKKEECYGGATCPEQVVLVGVCGWEGTHALCAFILKLSELKIKYIPMLYDSVLTACFGGRFLVRFIFIIKRY